MQDERQYCEETGSGGLTFWRYSRFKVVSPEILAESPAVGHVVIDLGLSEALWPNYPLSTVGTYTTL